MKFASIKRKSQRHPFIKTPNLILMMIGDGTNEEFYEISDGNLNEFNVKVIRTF